MSHARRSSRPLIALLLLLLGSTVLAQSRPSSQPTVRGSLVVEKGVRVLRLHGSHRDMGFAHGYLLGEEIIEGLQSYVIHSPVVGGPRGYSGRVIPLVRKMMTFSGEHREELAGMLDGIRAQSGNGAHVAALERGLELIDLEVLNTYGDWYAFGCSSFSAWGSLTSDGQTITGRNFDFPPAPILERTQLLVAVASSDASERRWVGVSFPGVIGVISGMSEDGVGMFVHDVRPRKKGTQESGVHSRLLAVREALEEAAPAGAVAFVHKKLQSITTFMGNNVHVTSPRNGDDPPAGVVEYDGVEAESDGADLRCAAASEPFVLCTNHYRSRLPPQKCGRYSKLARRLGEIAGAGEKIDAKAARELMASIVQNAFFSRTLHTVIFFPAERRFELMLGKAGKVAPASEPVPFTLAELLPPRR